jgi:hypothetical protein
MFLHRLLNHLPLYPLGQLCFHIAPSRGPQRPLRKIVHPKIRPASNLIVSPFPLVFSLLPVA